MILHLTRDYDNMGEQRDAGCIGDELEIVSLRQTDRHRFLKI